MTQRRVGLICVPRQQPAGTESVSQVLNFSTQAAQPPIYDLVALMMRLIAGQQREEAQS